MVDVDDEESVECIDSLIMIEIQVLSGIDTIQSNILLNVLD